MTIRIKQQHGNCAWIVCYLLATLRRIRLQGARVPSTYQLLEWVEKLLSSQAVTKIPLKETILMSSIDQELDYFAKSEFDCRYTGENEMQDAFLLKLDALRARCDFPFAITSGYRDLSHPSERDKVKATGTHPQGIAADIKVVDGIQRFKIISEAIKMGFTGIGVAKTFVHLDTRVLDVGEEPVMWNY
jgi:zinc D-Ala-D-Ala carboxypeptidase